MKNKKLFLFLLIAFPSLFWLVLELSTINSKKLPYYGPKTYDGKDTVFYKVEETTLTKLTGDIATQEKIDTVRFPLYTIVFINQQYKQDAFRLSGLLEYTQYKKSNVDQLPLFLVSSYIDSLPSITYRYKDSLKITNTNIQELYSDEATIDQINKQYFAKKPYYVDSSYIVLVDKKRHIRGYYDGRYVSEVKRLLEEYKHLRLKEEQHVMLKNNAIQQQDQKDK